MLNSVTVKVNGKINLSLSVNGKTNNGYHCLDMVMASVNIADTVTVARRADKMVTVRMEDAKGRQVDIKPELNSAYRAAAGLTSGFGLPGCDITVAKNIPFAAGLGGSSADAAAVIFALAKMHGIDVKSSGAYLIAFKCGSDVPYMLEGGFAHVYGRGEKINQITARPKLHIVVAKGGAGCPTREAYAAYDSAPRPKYACNKAPHDREPRPPYPKSDLRQKDSNTADILRALAASDASALAPLLHNDLQEASISLCPEIASTLELLKSTNPLCSLMTGSGSACYGLYPDAASARAARDKIKDKVEFSAACETLPRGIELIKAE